jgi:hypothetical protein
MATIVDIRNAAVQRSRRALGVRGPGSAEILLFTGVRYERWIDDTRNSGAAGRTRTRDHLELED